MHGKGDIRQIVIRDKSLRSGEKVIFLLFFEVLVASPWEVVTLLLQHDEVCPWGEEIKCHAEERTVLPLKKINFHVCHLESDAKLDVSSSNGCGITELTIVLLLSWLTKKVKIG